MSTGRESPVRQPAMRCETRRFICLDAATDCVVPRLTEKATARVVVAAVAQRGQAKDPTQLLPHRLGVHLRIPFVRESVSKGLTPERRETGRFPTAQFSSASVSTWVMGEWRR